MPKVGQGEEANREKKMYKKTLCIVARQIQCATLPRITLSGKIIIFKVFSREILPVDAV